MLKVSIIIPTYNYAQYIGETLKSVFNQTYKNFEVIVVDDGSTDSTGQIVKRFSAKNKKIKYIKHSRNMGFAQAMNTGVKHAVGLYLNFLSADDVLLPNLLEKEAEALDKRSDVAIAYSPVIFIDESGREVGKQRVQNFRILKDGYASLIIGNHINLVTCLVRTSILKSCGSFNTYLKQMPDWDMWLRVSRKGSIAYVPEYLALYRVHEASLTGTIRRNFENIGKERRIVLEETIKEDVPKKLKPWFPLLFLDARAVSDKLPKAIQKVLAVFSTGISILTTKLIRLFYRFH